MAEDLPNSPEVKQDETKVEKTEPALKPTEPTNATTPGAVAPPPNPMPLAGEKLEDLIAKRYIECHDAYMNAKTIDELMVFHSEKNRENFNKKMAAFKEKTGQADLKTMQAVLGLMRGLYPRKVKIDKVVVKDNQAVISASSTDSGAMGDAIGMGLNAAMGVKPTTMYTTATGEIKMTKENGEWMIDSESWNSETSALSPQQQAKKKAENAWCAEAATLPFPQKPAGGKLHGQPFKVTRVEMSKDNNLHLSEGTQFFPDREVTIFIFDMNGAPDGQSVIHKEGKNMTKARCHVHIGWKAVGKEDHTYAYTGMDDIGLRLVFGKRKNGMLPGYIMLRLPDKQKSFVEGYFFVPAKS